jgi:hypothetical protein
MARRASSSAHPVWLLIAAVLVVAAVAGGFLIHSRSDPFRAVTVLPVQDYLQNSNSLRGNVYKLDVTIAKSIDWSASAGRLFAVDTNGEVLALLVPPQFNHLNIERGQRYVFKLEVAEKGVLRVQDVKKV